MLLNRFLYAVGAAMLLGLWTGVAPVCAATTGETNSQADLAKLERYMPPLKNDRGDRWPVLFWNFAPQDEAMMHAWVERGAIPLSVGDWGNAPAAPFLHYLQDHHVPVIFLAQGLVQNAFRQRKQKFGDQDSPAWLVENPRLKQQAQRAANLARSLKSEGITPASVWIDFEAAAYLRNAGDREENVRRMMDKALNNPADIQKFGRDLLNSPKEYQAVVNRARAHAIRVAFSDPIHAVFPKAMLGNYYAWPIGRAMAKNPQRYQGRYPAYGYENSGMSVAQPRCYFTVAWGGSANASQEQISWNVFQYCLDRFSRAAGVLRPGEKLVPWVGYLFSGSSEGAKVSRRKAPAGGQIASSNVYREMVRHVMLRGAETLAVFSPETLEEPFTREYPDDFSRRAQGPLLVNLVDVQQAYDEMLRFNDILRHGKVLNYTVPDREHPGPVWSGVETDGKALIRTVTFGDEPVEQSITLFGKAIKLPFQKAGRFFWVDSDGRVEAIRP